jgi:glucose-6-phosphate 1-dehydrogenase
LHWKHHERKKAVDGKQKRNKGRLVTKVVSGDSYWSPEFCRIEPITEPCSIVIFGASGDLTKRKLIPALYNLACNKLIPKKFFIIGAGRTELSDEEFRKMLAVTTNVKSMTKTDKRVWEKFARGLYYCRLDYDDMGDYKALLQRLYTLERKNDLKRNRIFYIATPPDIYETIVDNLGRCGFSEEGDGCVRIVIEKPFGKDLTTARQLNECVHRYFKEKQIFRIDHCLGKETVQDIHMFRFANTIFEPIWNRQYIDHVQITAAETLGVESRAGYYEQAGVLRDMFQNHMFQLLSLVAMEPPAVFEADDVRDEKVKVFKSIKSISLDKLEDFIVLGQYRKGEIEGREVPGYQSEPGVAKGSRIPTFAAMKLFIDNWRWKGVPFYLRSGKRMSQRLTEIVISFKDVPHLMFHEVMGDEIGPNVIILRIQPNEGIRLIFQVKLPGSKVCLRSVMMDFTYKDFYQEVPLDAYERVLLDCMLGDHMLFVREDSVECTWSTLTPVLEAIESRKGRRYPIYRYKAGSRGPQAADHLLERDGNKWIAV